MSEGNATLKEAFRHHAWATRGLLAFCTQLRPDQLSQPRPAPLAGVHGSILETFDHIVASDGGYLGALTGHRPAWAVAERATSPDLGELASRVDEAEALWIGFLSIPDDADRRVLLDDGTYETHAAIVT
ncbi:MAG TPA: DinB family protein, partial [Candidatus Dormibacteraeota bacterium]